jgi:hypothetical protein
MNKAVVLIGTLCWIFLLRGAVYERKSENKVPYITSHSEMPFIHLLLTSLHYFST